MDLLLVQHWLKEHYPDIYFGEKSLTIIKEYAAYYHAKRMIGLPTSTNDTQAGYIEQELAQAKEAKSTNDKLKDLVREYFNLEHQIRKML